MHIQGHVRLLTLIAVLALQSACGTTKPDSGSIIRTAYDADNAAPFTNVLVISVAGEYPTRVSFEQQFAAAVSGEETQVTAYYTVVGRNPQLTREFLETAVKARDFDAVVLIRLKGQDHADLVADRPTGQQFDLFHYDYEELNTPASIRVGSTVSFVVEVYDAALGKKVWAVESLIFETKSVDAVIADQVAAIIDVLLRDDLIRQ